MVMKVWSAQLPELIPPFEFIQLGSFQSLSDSFKSTENKKLIEIREPTDIHPSASEQDSFYIPAGSYQRELIEPLINRKHLIYIAINGFGNHAFSELKQFLNKVNSVFVFEAEACGKFDFLEQLGWLASQNHPFAIAGEDKEQLLTACILRPEALILNKSFPSWISELEHLYSITQPQAAKPLAVAEIDALSGSEMGLVLTNDLPAGHILASEDLTPSIVSNRGLGLHLLQIIVGLKLRYSLKRGEPITFGFLQDPHYAK
jgi:hypothetical protein